METDYQNYVESLSGVSSDDDDISTVDSSDEAEEPTNSHNHPLQPQSQTRNLVQILYDRERTGFFSGRSRAGQKQKLPYDQVPNRLKLYLKDVLANNTLEGHIFMGLTACGQYMISHRVECNDSTSLNHYSFNVGYKYTLYFWLFQPHKKLRYFFSRRLFDDHVVDNVKSVTMTQWKNADKQILVVHGAAMEESEESYITYVKVPKLGCLECKKLCDDGPYSFYNAHCLNCHLTVHTKYSSTETDPRFVPTINLLCPERILIISNGFVHMLRIDVDTPVVPNNNSSSLPQQNFNLPSTQHTLFLPRTPLPNEEDRCSVPFTGSEADSEHSVVARIIADFSDIETDHTQRTNSNNNNNSNNIINNNENPQRAGPEHNSSSYEKLIFSSNCGNALSTSSMTLMETSLPVSMQNSVGTNDSSQSRRRNQRIVTKSYRNGITTIDMQHTSTSSSMTDKSNAYEFSEDNEKCEKISTFRKRRLADKKYEFSEDNSENIIPFTKIRSAGRTTFSPSTASSTAQRSLHRFSPTAHYFHNSPCASPSSSPHPAQPSHTPPPPLHLGFRSPPSSSNLMRSPSRNANAATVAAQIYNQKSPPLSQATQQMLSYKPVGPLGALSPLQVSMAKRFEIGGSMSPNASLSFLSPRRDEQRIVEMPVQGGVMTEKPVCTKKLRRRYVDEDDATSVITSEEDDCISPGYHTSLPMEVHGSCYSEMQMISQSSYQRLRCSSVVITQHSFDLETFTYYVISMICQKHQKIYNVFYDWAYEFVNVCPLSQTISFMLMAQFSARDQMPTAPTNCMYCTGRMGCVFHNRQYECRILFTWNMESGQWQVLDYGELREMHELFSPLRRLGKSRLTFAQLARQMAQEMAASLSRLPDYTSNLRILSADIKKSKTSICDLDNMVEFHLKRTNTEVL
ncbi:hypothetical protein AWZ03_011166 [Drosophila navojoa]|uniref:DDB1- and CUL4-associated factor 15 WD40 repeat-containing domain-containing protein n=1 Tax=Drosophila navojoa TaxID=7232 RepID=A0A484B113_DRONA|nr:uncharacterized protein LOC108659970 isoform X1 [Drosophila navojoa]TDG42418.1 hypothetical protein AWZ03_011166 [Drosophila navojoa]